MASCLSGCAAGTELLPVEAMTALIKKDLNPLGAVKLLVKHLKPPFLYVMYYVGTCILFKLLPVDALAWDAGLFSSCLSGRAAGTELLLVCAMIAL
jgi:hypothetical protein